MVKDKREKLVSEITLMKIKTLYIMKVWGEVFDITIHSKLQERQSFFHKKYEIQLKMATWNA